MEYANEDECIHTGLDPDTIDKMAKDLARIGKKMDACGIHLFGSGGGGLLLKSTDARQPPFVVADVEGPYDGGDDTIFEDSNGLKRIHK